MFENQIFKKSGVVLSIITVLVLAATGFSPVNLSKESRYEAQVASLEISPKESNAGLPVTIIIGIENPASQSVEYSIPVNIQGIEEEVIFGVLSPGARKKHLVSAIRNNPGVYTVSIRELTETFVINSANFTEEIISVFPSIVEPGTTTSIQGMTTNVGGVPGVYKSTVFLDGVPVGESTGILLPQESEPLAFEILITRPGVHVVSMGNSSLSFLSLPPLLEAIIPHSIPISKQRTVAVNSKGDPIQVIGEAINIKAVNGNELTLELPFKLPFGENLAGFSDIATGVKYDGEELSIPLPIDEGKGEISLRVSFHSLSGSGNHVIGVAQKVWIEFKDVSVNLRIIDPEIGSIAFEGMFIPETLPIGSVFQIKAYQILDFSLRVKLNQSLLNSGDQIGAVALGFDVVKKETGEPLKLKSGLLKFSLSSTWIEKFSSDSSVRLIVLNGELPEISVTERVEYDPQNRLIFQATFGSTNAQFRIVTLVSRIHSQQAVVESFRFNPEAIAPGDLVEIIGELMDDHQRTGAIPISLYKEKEMVNSHIWTSAGKMSDTVRFFLKLTEQGTYSIGLNQERKKLAVALPLDPIDVLVTSLIPSATAIPIGSPLSFSLSVSNQGNRTGLALPILRMNEVQAKVIPLVLDPGETKEAETTIFLNQPGPYRFDIGKIGVSVDVLPRPPESVFTINDLEINPGIVDPGEPAVLQMRLTNNNYGESEFSGQVEIGNNVIAIGPISVPSLTTIFVRKQLIIFKSGIQKGNLNGQVFELEVRKAKETSFEVSDLSVSPKKAKQNRPISVTATLSNSLQVLGKDEIILKVDGMIVSSEWAWLGPGMAKDVVFEISESELGSHSITVNGSESTFKVERIIPLIILIPAGTLGLLGGIVGVYFGRKYWTRIKLVFRHRLKTGK